VYGIAPTPWVDSTKRELQQIREQESKAGALLTISAPTRLPWVSYVPTLRTTASYKVVQLFPLGSFFGQKSDNGLLCNEE
jgi:hypothetical protein